MLKMGRLMLLSLFRIHRSFSSILGCSPRLRLEAKSIADANNLWVPLVVATLAFASPEWRDQPYSLIENLQIRVKFQVKRRVQGFVQLRCDWTQKKFIVDTAPTYVSLCKLAVHADMEHAGSDGCQRLDPSNLPKALAAIFLSTEQLKWPRMSSHICMHTQYRKKPLLDCIQDCINGF